MMQLGDLTPLSAVASLWTNVGSWSTVDEERGHEVLCVDQVLDCTPWAKKESGDSNRDISELLDKAFTQRVLEQHPTLCGRLQGKTSVTVLSKFLEFQEISGPTGLPVVTPTIAGCWDGLDTVLVLGAGEL